MGFKIVWTKKAVQTFGKRIAYLEANWTEKEIFKFTASVNEYLTVLQVQPLMFRTSKKLKTVHLSVIVKHVSLVYRVKVSTQTVELIAFIDTRQNPKKQNY